MKRNTASTLKALDPNILRAALTLAHLIKMRAKLDRASTEDLTGEIVKSLLLAAEGREEPTP